MKLIYFYKLKYRKVHMHDKMKKKTINNVMFLLVLILINPTSVGDEKLCCSSDAVAFHGT